MRIFTNTHYDFIRWRWHAIAVSALVIIAGFALIAVQGPKLGIDFSGGTLVIYKFAQPVTEDAVRTALDSVPGEKVVQQYGDPASNQLLIRLPQSRTAEQGFNLEKDALAVRDALAKAGLPTFEEVSREVVGPVVGADLQRKGLYATIASIIGITIYIGLRFRFSFAVGAMAATLHDILVTLAFLQFFGYELSLNVIAAILTITGYSVNDTIVIFDRVRENQHLLRRESLEKVVNDSVNQTLSRTIITAGTTFLAVLSLYIFGGEVLEGFAFTMLVGIVSGTYSTIFIAAAVAIILSKQQAAAAAASTPSSSLPSAPPNRERTRRNKEKPRAHVS
jgi:preprotein translocase subunit SecF